MCKVSRAFEYIARLQAGQTRPCALRIFAIALLLCVFLAGTSARARTGARPLFEPTDLQLQQPGFVNFDYQLGVIRGRDAWRVVAPDFELNVGILRNLEFDLDATYALEGTSGSPFTHAHATPDALWTSVKFGLLDWYDERAAQTWALGFQVGPKLPIALGSRGIGLEGLALLGYVFRGTHLVLNTGALVDPHPSPAESRPLGIEVGLDIDSSLEKEDRFAFVGELAGVKFFSPDPHQFLTTAGLRYSPLSYLDMSVIALWGWLDGSDRYGLLLGVSPKLRWLANTRD